MKINIVFTFFLAWTITYSQMPDTISNVDKLYGLSTFWQEVNYNFIYFNKINRQEWNNEYKTLLSEVQKTQNDYEYYRLLQKFCASLNDGHTNVYFPKNIREMIYNTNFGEYRIFLSNIDGKAVVTRINMSKKEELPIGTEVIKVNGLETKDYVTKHVMPYISSSTDYILEDYSISRLFQAPIGTAFDVDFKLPNGKIKSLHLIHKKTIETEVFPPFEDRQLLNFKWIDKKIAYVSLNSFANPKIDSLFINLLPELYKAKKLIIDLRFNGGGVTSIGLNILKYLTNDTILYGSKSVSKLHIPSYKAWGKFQKEKDTINNEWSRQAYLTYRNEYYHKFDYQPDTIKLDVKRIKVPTVLLIGHNTASAAEDFLIYADNQEHMTMLGEPSFGSTGQPLLFDLPGGGSARICTKKDMYPDGREFVGVGIQPDIKISKSLSDYLENKDPALDKAIEYLKSQ